MMNFKTEKGLLKFLNLDLISEVSVTEKDGITSIFIHITSTEPTLEGYKIVFLLVRRP